jgi:hypothetical protein
LALLALLLVFALTGCDSDDQEPGYGAAPATTVAAAAPDFTLALGAGGTFRLSEEKNPVYLLFWAEW